MKKLLSILLATTLLLTLFIGCSKSDKPTDASTEETVTTETVEDIVDELTEDVTVEETTVDNDGNEITVGKDADGNTVEIKTAKDGTVTKTVTDKNTGKKTEQTTTVATKPVTTTKKPSDNQTTKPAGTKPNKPAETTTKKTETTTKHTETTKPPTTQHTHNWVKKSKQVLVKEAYDEPEMKRMQAYYCSGCGMECGQASRDYGCDGGAQMFHMKHCRQGNYNDNNSGNIPICDMHLHPEWDSPKGNTMVMGSTIGKPNFVLRETGKTIHHDAEYRTETWYECSCGATKSD